MGRQSDKDHKQSSGIEAQVALQGSITKRRRGANGECDTNSVKSNSQQLSALQEKFRRRLQSGQFREINEMFYTNSSAQAAEVLLSNPALYSSYHAGFADQVRRWPINPVDHIVKYLQTQPDTLRIADLGCGNARLSREVPQTVVHNFDLVAANETVRACDIANVPLSDSSVDMTVFCLSLMGTNYGQFLEEAWRILVTGGWMLVAEVASRFEDQNADQFKKAVQHIGFKYSPSHPIVLDMNNLDKRQYSLSRNSKLRTNKAQRGKGKSKVAGNNLPGQGKESSPYFLIFAFQKKQISSCRRSIKMPPLKACAYKRR